MKKYYLLSSLAAMSIFSLSSCSNNESKESKDTVVIEKEVVIEETEPSTTPEKTAENATEEEKGLSAPFEIKAVITTDVNKSKVPENEALYRETYTLKLNQNGSFEGNYTLEENNGGWKMKNTAISTLSGRWSTGSVPSGEGSQKVFELHPSQFQNNSTIYIPDDGQYLYSPLNAADWSQVRNLDTKNAATIVDIKK